MAGAGFEDFVFLGFNMLDFAARLADSMSSYSDTVVSTHIIGFYKNGGGTNWLGISCRLSRQCTISLTVFFLFLFVFIFER